MSKITLGLDVSKAQFDAAILFENNKVKTKKFDNKLSGFVDMTEWLKKYDALGVHACLEATGIYSEALATYCSEAGHLVSVVNPAQIKGFAQSELVRTKTDKADNQLIARFCRAIQPPLWQPKPLHIRELQAWVRRLEGLQGLYQQETNRLEVVPACIQSSVKAIVKRLAKEIVRVKKKIKEHIEQYSALRDKKVLLETIPGIGDATIAQILAFISNIEDFKNARQLAAFVGLNPKQRQSGSSVQGHTRLSKIGNANLRKAFYMPAIVSKRYNPIIRALSERLESAGKPTMLIIGAAMRKLVHIVYGVLKSGKAFDANWAT
jgi:transposase